jgi:hypothetical protein
MELGGWRKLHSEKLHTLYASPHIIREIKTSMRWVGHAACMGKMTNAYKMLVGRPEGKRPLGRLWHRLKHNIRLAVRERGWDVVDWIHLAHNTDQWWAVVKTVINF